MKIQPCRTYRAASAGQSLVDLPDGRSCFKIYYVSITGRDDLARYEWEAAPFTRADFEARFRASGEEGVGFVTAFPHITKVFRFAPAAETILHVRALDTRTLAPLDLARGEGWMEFACYAEALIAADEYRAWAVAADVAAWRGFRSGYGEAPVRIHDKLLRYWGG